MEKEIYWSADTEIFNYESLQDLINSESDLEVGDVVEYGEKAEHDYHWVNACDIIEMIGKRGYDAGGEYADDFPDVDDEAKMELESFISEWQRKNCKASFFRIKNVSEYTITEADLS